MKIISLGEILWDVYPDAERLGGAPFNLAAHACRLGHEVYFVSAVGADERGRRALDTMAELGLSTDYVRVVEQAPTGMVGISLDANGQPSFSLHRPAAYDYAFLEPPQVRSLSSSDWICYGTLQQTTAGPRRALQQLVEANPASGRLYDVNLRCGGYDPALVRELLDLATVVKLNENEAAAIAEMSGRSPQSLAATVCVTRGAAGCTVFHNDTRVDCPAFSVTVVDAVGAGDAFSAAFLHGLGNRWELINVADFANRLGALVASRRGAVPPWTLEECWALTR